MWCLPTFNKRNKTPDKPKPEKKKKKSSSPVKSSEFKPKKKPSSPAVEGKPPAGKPPKPPKPLSIKLRLFRGRDTSKKYKECISVVTEAESVAESEQYKPAANRSDSYRRSCSDIERWVYNTLQNFTTLYTCIRIGFRLDLKCHRN